ncbi:hypothetical protein TNCV_4253131 [Trichonephila clavipes]|nr:hypothetical protein TNCV_4253131 [Trichonephila clavipes]
MLLSKIASPHLAGVEELSPTCGHSIAPDEGCVETSWKSAGGTDAGTAIGNAGAQMLVKLLELERLLELDHVSALVSLSLFSRFQSLFLSKTVCIPSHGRDESNFSVDQTVLRSSTCFHNEQLVTNKNNGPTPSIKKKIARCVSVAQRVARWTSNPKVVDFES